LKKYMAFSKIFFKAQIIYRFDVAVTAIEALGRILFAWLIWGAVFAGRDVVGGFTFRSMLLYYVVSSCIATLDICFGVSSEINHEVRNGLYTKFMVIPINQQLYWLSKNLGVVSYLAMFVLPVALISGWLFGAGGYAGQPAAAILGLLMIPLGLAFMVTFHFFIGIHAFKFHDVGFFIYFQSALVQFTQGGVIPINLLPDTVLNILRLLPFPHVIYTPSMLLIGGMDFREGLFSAGVLIVWLAGMSAAAQFAYKRLRIKYDGVGI